MIRMLDLLLHRRSIRKFTTEPVAEADIEKILQAGLLSPSGRNKTPWEFVVIEDKATLNALGKCRRYSVLGVDGRWADIYLRKDVYYVFVFGS